MGRGGSVQRQRAWLLPIQRMTEVRIWRYLVFWAVKKVKGPNSSVKML